MKRKILLLILLIAPLSGCHYKSNTGITGNNLVTPYGTGDVNIQHNVSLDK